MNTPSYKCYQNLYDHVKKIIEYLERKKIKKRLLLELDFLTKLIRFETNISTMNMNYDFHIDNLDEHISAILYQVDMYKFPRIFNKTITRLKKYHLRHQKM